MRASSLFSVLAFTGLTLADLDFSKWAPPGPGDERGPCPALNSLANHGFLPHDGKNITIPLLVQVTGEVFNLSTELATVIGGIALATAPDPAQGFFDLPNLDKHNAFEHDASLSRTDYYFSGDPGDAKFNQTLFNQFLSFFEGEKYISLPAAAAARYARVQYSRVNTPGFTYGDIQQITSYAETIKYFRTMVEPETGLVPVDFVKILFEQERLPFNEGWRPPNTVTNGFVIAEDVLLLALSTPEKSLYFNEVPPKNTNQTTFDVPVCYNKQCHAKRLARTISA